jgi:hypothetical protein
MAGAITYVDRIAPGAVHKSKAVAGQYEAETGIEPVCGALQASS